MPADGFDLIALTDRFQDADSSAVFVKGVHIIYHDGSVAILVAGAINTESGGVTFDPAGVWRWKDTACELAFADAGGAEDH